LSKIVREARRIDIDPRRDGFGHNNPNLGLDDDLLFNALAIDRMIEGLFRGRDLSANEEQFMRLIRVGTLDGMEGFDLPMSASVRAMRFSSAVSMRLWAMFEEQKQRVCFLEVDTIKCC
jgi:hypothetical protein